MLKPSSASSVTMTSRLSVTLALEAGRSPIAIVSALAEDRPPRYASPLGVVAAAKGPPQATSVALARAPNALASAKLSEYSTVGGCGMNPS